MSNYVTGNKANSSQEGVWPDDTTATLYPVTVEAVPEFSVDYLYGDQKRKTRVIEPEAEDADE